ncbi:hypothetical protein QJS66_00700 [Kocuria rhizophila]|nr:hypothetical protein QJS66_00700 [Kocuria rhizophila]
MPLGPWIDRAGHRRTVRALVRERRAQASSSAEGHGLRRPAGAPTSPRR